MKFSRLLVVAATILASVLVTVAAGASTLDTPFTTPDAPTLTSVVGGNGAVTATWTAPDTDGGSPLTGYTATATDGTNVFTCSTTALTCVVTGLTNGVAYSVSVVATNLAGNSTSSNSLAATPFTTPDAPTLTSVVGTNGAVTATWSAPDTDGGSPLTGYTATATDGTNVFTCSTTALTCVVTGLTNGVSYSVSVVATNLAGNSVSSNSLAATPFTTPDAPTLTSVVGTSGAVTATWSAPDTDGGSPLTGYTATATDGTNVFTCSTTALTCAITGLTNGVSYSVSVVATNLAGNSTSSNSLAATPFTTPDAPTLTSVVGTNGAVTATWSAPDTDGGSPLTGYTATATDGTNVFTCSTTALTCVVTGLTNGVSYSVSVVATNLAGNSVSSNSLAATPFTTPDAPTLTSVVGTSGAVTATWSAPDTDGGSPLTGYTATATDGTNVFTCSTTALTCVVTGLTNGVSYSVSVVATNLAGNSVSSNSLAATPFTTPDAPTLTSVVGGNGAVTATWSAPDTDGGSPLTGYTATATDGTNVFTCSTTALTCAITGLTNGVSYSVSVVATNLAGNSVSSNSLAATPFTTPDAPTLTSVVGTSGAVTATWSAPDTDGGSPLTGYTATATDGTNVFTCSTTALTCAITGLTNGVSYSVSVVATNLAGNSTSSNTLGVTLVTVPGAPLNVTLRAGSEEITVSWGTPATTGGSRITGYTATALSGGHHFMCTTTTTLTCVITGLTNGVSYSVSVVATNTKGASPASASVTATPFTVPVAPMLNVVQPKNRSFSVFWLAPKNDGGSAILYYKATATNGPHRFTCTSTTLSCSLVGLTSGAVYSVAVVAVNAAGPSAASNEVIAIPLSLSGAPHAVKVRVGNRSLSVFWTKPKSDGGAKITGYTARALAGSVAVTCSSTRTSCSFGSLTDGVTYRVSVRATTAAGVSPASNVLTATPFGRPGAPRLVALRPANGAVTATWTKPTSDNGAAVTGYTATAVGGGTHTTCTSVALSCTITDLLNGVRYAVSVVATNKAGASAPSNSLTANLLFPPGVPVITKVLPANASMTVYWNKPATNGGSAITGYVAHLQAGTSIVSCDTTTTDCTFGGLTNDVPYRVSVVATNHGGSSAAATFPVLVYPVASTSFAVDATQPVSVAGNNFTVLVSGLAAGSVATASVAALSAACTTNAVGECTVVFNQPVPGTWTIKATATTGGKHHTSPKASVSIARVSTSSTTLTKGSALTVSIVSGVANSVLVARLGSGAPVSRTLSSAGNGTVSVVTTSAGTQTLSISDDGVVLVLLRVRVNS